MASLDNPAAPSFSQMRTEDRGRVVERNGMVTAMDERAREILDAAYATLEARQRAELLRPILAELAGMTARAIARELNERKVPLPGRGPWHAMTVIRVQRRLKGKHEMTQVIACI